LSVGAIAQGARTPSEVAMHSRRAAQKDTAGALSMPDRGLVGSSSGGRSDGEAYVQHLPFD